MEILITLAEWIFWASCAVLAVYAVRHYWFGIYRLTMRFPRESMELAGFYTPRISVFLPMHNEEAVAEGVLRALVDCDYDWEQLEILAINDRSSDRTGEIIDHFAERFPVVKALHRSTGNGGKAGALEFAGNFATGDIFLFFDADYVPGRSLLKFLTVPFLDPAVGATMGRVMPHNAGASLLAGMLSLERAAGYQVGQQARHGLGLTVQFGGTVGGVRRTALESSGGWNTASLTEDTDLTCRLLLKGWRISYVNRAECYEEVPESWEVRRRQLMRWVSGHTQCLLRYGWELARCRRLSLLQRADTLLLLACYLTAPLMVAGWLASLILLFSQRLHGIAYLSAALLVAGYQLFGSQATFLELGAAALLDGMQTRASLIPLNLVNFFASTGAICEALARFAWKRIFGGGDDSWYRTLRFRGSGSPFIEPAAGAAGLFHRAANGLYFADGEEPKS